MLRRKIEKYLNSWKNDRSTALLIKGARQIGKTCSIEHFIKENFENVVEINFAAQSDLVPTFADLKNSNDLIVKISLAAGKEMIPGKTVIFLDEIQLVYRERAMLKKLGKIGLESQDILTAMKQNVINGEYRFILSGSLLGIFINDVLLQPLGYLDEIEMFPLDFEEFLWAKNVGDAAIKYLKDCFQKREPVDEQMNKLFLNYFNEYAIVGGMPEAVVDYVERKNLYLVQQSQERITRRYLLDITDYTESTDSKLKIKEVYIAMPSELNSKNKRFISSKVLDKSYIRRSDIVDNYLWLTNAGVAIPVYNVTEPAIPLILASERKTLKLFLNDAGLLCNQLFDTGIREKLLNGEKIINFGAPYENVCAQLLWSHGFKEKLFYYNSKKHGELDFVIEKAGSVVPLEIKSGKPNQMNTYNHSALTNVMDLYPIDEAYLFGECNIAKEKDNTYQFPVYMIDFLKADSYNDFDI